MHEHTTCFKNLNLSVSASGEFNGEAPFHKNKLFWKFNEQCIHANGYIAYI